MGFETQVADKRFFLFVFAEVRKVAGHITPVPGGVGPMTVAMLMKNTFIAAKNLAQKRAGKV